MKKALVLAVVLVLAGGVAYANYCARDIVPASTLLVPWGAVDLNADGTVNPSGWTTMFAITNVSADPVLVHFTLWTIKSEHVVDWDEVLSGYDVWTMNFRDLLAGRFDLFDTGSQLFPNTPVQPYGPSTNNATVPANLPNATDVPLAADPFRANCRMPYGNLSYLSSAIIGPLQTAMRAQTTQDASACRPGTITNPTWLPALAKNPVWFYLTADVVSACNIAFPDQAAYWNSNTGGTRFPKVSNVLIGDIFWLNNTLNYSDSIPAVHIEADTQVQATTHGTGASPAGGFVAFYDRYSRVKPLVPVNDDREPLPTAWAFRYITAGGVTTKAVVWKSMLEADTPVNGTTNACRPYAYWAWDEDEHTRARGGGGPSGFDTAEPNAFPFESQEVAVTPGNLDGLPAVNGWILLVFDPSLIPANPNAVAREMAWVGVRYVLPGTPNYSTALEAATMANAWCFPTQVLPQLGVNFNYTDGDNVPARY